MAQAGTDLPKLELHIKKRACTACRQYRPIGRPGAIGALPSFCRKGRHASRRFILAERPCGARNNARESRVEVREAMHIRSMHQQKILVEGRALRFPEPMTAARLDRSIEKTSSNSWPSTSTKQDILCVEKPLCQEILNAESGLSSIYVDLIPIFHPVVNQN